MKTKTYHRAEKAGLRAEKVQYLTPINSVQI